ncbi:PIG-L family deacetylase [Cyanobacteria bacterium FACHB-63]|nr:PIG-L family deacetylase [Cyanobacteria bacterium FACHB-63]
MQMIKGLIRLAQTLQFNILSYWFRHYSRRVMIVSDRPSLIIAPHQDDETLGCGGLITLKRQLGVRVAVVFLTDGGGTCVSLSDYEHEVNLRRQEAIAALNLLGVPGSDIHFLNYPDGKLQNLSASDRQDLLTQLQQLLEQYEAEEVYAPHAKDGHCDHEAAFQLAYTATVSSRIQLFQYPIWLFWRRSFLLQLKWRDLAGAYRLNIGSVSSKKQRAIRIYQSQLSILPFGFLNPFWSSTELFFVQAMPKPEQETLAINARKR